VLTVGSALVAARRAVSNDPRPHVSALVDAGWSHAV